MKRKTRRRRNKKEREKKRGKGRDSAQTMPYGKTRRVKKRRGRRSARMVSVTYHLFLDDVDLFGKSSYVPLGLKRRKRNSRFFTVEIRIFGLIF